MEIKNKKFTRLKLDSAYLPSIEDIDRPDDAKVTEVAESFKEFGQIHPIVVCKITETGKWELVVGRARLLAAHRNGWELIDALTGTLATMDDVAKYRLQENKIRSDNIIGDYLAIRETLNETLDWELTAKVLGLRVSVVKQLDNDFCKVPLVFLTAAVDGKIATSTVKQIGRLSADAHKSLKKVLKKKDKITAQDVKELKQARIREIVDDMPEEFFSVSGTAVKTFSESQLRWILTIAKSNGESFTQEAIEKLLGE